ncbi:uncharacterized protein LOC578345 isoform X1 [Strongylocentrotus purpuratus]|uniref:Phosphoinositide phospholipase C n=1 Tax=Strongylocentrotus purpuratus TaxID=7668 RepID=A0A7M7NVL5_STRPU|nr:uncharacterized protein LOC578345 isoform X1 [Strongylocentrotus purpuratus]XP_030842361.1 uncharacterized protein LOC578345 isoform X1 [Strongylocentrotus purpuratus]XP_030842362.1 uncharacterized protein LOC578345 isoform X1 [Strongylocentrotus purpuratus]
METGESSTHLSVSRTSTVDSTTSNDSSFDDPQQEEVKGERSLQRNELCEVNNIPGDARRPSVGLRETKIIISQDDSVTIDNEGVVEDEEEETRKRSESLHKLHQQHALDSWDQEGDSASSSSRSSSTTRISPRLSPSPSHRARYQVRHTSRSSSSAPPPPNINSSISLMCLGSSVMKVKRQGRTSSKMLYLDSTRSYIRWKPSKKGHKAIVNIKNVREIREGACTDIFKKHLASTAGHKPSHCFSIIHGTSWESLDIVAGSLDEARAWIRGLRHLMEQAQEETAQSDQLRDSWLKSVFESADKSGDGLLSMDEVLKLLHKLNVNLSKRKVKQLFREADTNIDEHLGKLDFDEFVHFYKTLSMRPELYGLLREYSCGKEHMTLEDVDVFLRNEQDINKLNEEGCNSLIEKYEPVPENICTGRLGIDGLMRYLLSEEGDLFNPGHREVNQDMTQPLSHYYIASSHNTYLLGDQLMSQSSVDVYGLVLQAGCRCVELDTWDGKDGEPVIYHGYTLTSKIKFRDVITVVNKYAFMSSPYPVILSIENHCTLEQQKKMARYLLEILGDQLIISSPPEGSSGGLPSPESLKYKILIKAKKLPLDHDADLEAGEVSEEDSADELDEDFKLEKTETRSKFESIAMAQLALMRKKPISPSQQAWQKIAHKRLDRLKVLLEATELKEKNTENKASKNGKTGLTGTFRKLKATRRRAKLQHSSESDNNSSMEYDRSSSRDDDLEGGANENQQAEQAKQRMSSANRKRAFVLSRQLSDLVKYTRSVAFKGFPENMPCWELPSLGEMRANNLAMTRAADFATFSTHNMCRVYPSAYRIDSSNFNPQPLWNCGCQLVALNYQTEGRAMQLLRAKFRANGSCGYVLKPSILRQDKVHFDATSNNSIAGVQKKQLTIHIISGQQLPKPPQSLLGERGEIIDPYVEVEVVGLNGDCTKAQTRTVQDNGFNPVWDYVVTFPVTLPELTLVRFVVWDEDPIGRDFIGQATFPFTSLCQGYRHIHLEGLDHATVFVHVTIEDFTDKQKYIKNSKGLRSSSITRTTSSPSRNRTKSVDTEVNLMTGGSPSHQASPKRRTSLAERLGIRRRHSTTALLVEGIMNVTGGSGGIKSPTSPTSTPTFGLLRQKRRSYEGEMRKGRSQGDEEGCDDVFGDDDCDLSPVDCDAILDRIMSSEVAVELEADGSLSVPLNEIIHILRLGISPSQIIQVIQDGRLSLRPALHEVPPISSVGDSLNVAAKGELESSPMDTQEGLGSGILSKLEHYDPEPAPTLSRILDDDDLVFPMNNNDISTEMEALLSARFTKERLAFGMVSYDECSSTEDCSSLESAEVFVTDTPITDPPITDHVTNNTLTDHVTNNKSTDHVTNETSTDHVTNDTLTDQVTDNKSSDHVTNDTPTDHVTDNATGELLSGENGLVSGEVHAKPEQEIEIQEREIGVPQLTNSSEYKVEGNSEADGILDDPCLQENQGSNYDNQGDIVYDIVEQDDNVVHVPGHVELASQPNEFVQRSNQDDVSSNSNEGMCMSRMGNPSKFSSCNGNNDVVNAYSNNSYLRKNEDHCNLSLVDHSQGYMQYPEGRERQLSQECVKQLVQGQTEVELDSVSQGQTRNPEYCESEGQMDSLSNVVDSMFDLVASLAEQERELQTLEERNYVTKELNAIVSPSNGEENLYRKSPEDLHPNVGPPNCTEDTKMQVQTPKSLEYTGNTQFHDYSWHQSRHSEGPLNESELKEASCNLPDSSDRWNTHDQPRPLTRTGLSPDTTPLKSSNLTSKVNGDLPDDTVPLEHSSSSHRPRKKSLVKVLSGLFQKYELFDAKQTESFSKGIRSSLRRKFMTRSVPDISKMSFKQEEEDESKESNGYMQSVKKKVWSSSNQDIRTTRPVSKSFENLCGIMEESQTTKMARMFCSSYTNIDATENGCSPYRSELSDDYDTKMIPSGDHEPNGFVHMREQDVDESALSSVVVFTEDKAIQTDEVTNAVSLKDQRPKLNRLIRGSWNRNGQPTRPLSCPVLPQETSNESNKNRIVYFHEQPLDKPHVSSSLKQKNCTQGEGPNEDVEQQSKHLLDLEDIIVTLEDVSSEDPDSGDDAGDFSSHICMVRGCNCGVNDLSNLLDSSLLVETCFTGAEDEVANEVEQQMRSNFQKTGDFYARKDKQENDATERDATDDDQTSRTTRSVTPLRSIIDDKESNTSFGTGHSISSIHTHLGGARRSIGTFRSEYNRSFDDSDNTDDEGKTLTNSPQKTVSPGTCMSEQTPPDLKQESIISILDLKPIQEVEILEDSFSSESIPSLSSTDGTSASENIDTDPEQLDNPVDDGEASIKEEGEVSQEGNVTPTNGINGQCSSKKEADESARRTGQENNTEIVEEEARPKSVSSECSYDMFKSLDELSTVLDDELLHGRNHSRGSTPTCTSYTSHSIQPLKVITPIKEVGRSPTSSNVENSEDIRAVQNEFDFPSVKCSNMVLARPDKVPVGSSNANEERAHGRPPVPPRPVIGSGISVRFLGQIPRQMSAYTYSDSDSDYDSTTSGSSQETVVELIPQFARPMAKPLVPPKSPNLKAQLVKQGSKEKPPVPPKPQHIKALAAEKRAKALQKSNSLETSPDTTFPEFPSQKEDSSFFKFKGEDTVTGGQAGSIDGNGHKGILSSGMLSPGLINSLTSIPPNPSPTPSDPNRGPSSQNTPSLHEHLESTYGVTTRKKLRAKPPLEHRHSTGSLFSLADLPSINDRAAGLPHTAQETIQDEEFLEIWDQSLESWSLDRKKRSSQRVYFMLNV